MFKFNRWARLALVIVAELVMLVGIGGTVRAAHPAAVERVLDCLCRTHPQQSLCEDNRRERVGVVLDDLMRVTRSFDGKLPPQLAAVLAARACGEGGFASAPTCAGSRGCNDGGTSAGMMQIKRAEADPGGLADHYRKTRGRSLDYHDHAEAGRYLLERLILGVRKLSDKARCGRSVRERPKLEQWSIAEYRIGRGPWVEKPSKVTACAPDAFGVVVCMTTKDPGLQRCEPGSKYVRWSLAWVKAEPAAWSLSAPSTASN